MRMLGKLNKTAEANRDRIAVKSGDAQLTYAELFTQAAALAGWLAEHTEKREPLIVYGHNMRSGAMFAHLSRFAYPDFWPAHKTLRFDSLWETREYVVVACLRSVQRDDNKGVFGYFVDFADEEDFSRWLSFIRSMRYYDPGVDFGVEDNYLTLSTCSYHEEDGRLLVICRQLREGETASRLEMVK